MLKDRPREAIIAQVRAESEAFVRFDRVVALFLECVGADLVGEPDAPSLLTHVQEDAPAVRRDRLQNSLDQLVAVAPSRVKHVAGQTGRVHTHQHALAVADVAAHQRDVRLPLETGFVDMDLELTVLGRQLGPRHDAHVSASRERSKSHRGAPPEPIQLHQTFWTDSLSEHRRKPSPAVPGSARPCTRPSGPLLQSPLARLFLYGEPTKNLLARRDARPCWATQPTQGLALPLTTRSRGSDLRARRAPMTTTRDRHRVPGERRGFPPESGEATPVSS